jgi:hypothetical protein
MLLKVNGGSDVVNKIKKKLNKQESDSSYKYYSHASILTRLKVRRGG